MRKDFINRGRLVAFLLACSILCSFNIKSNNTHAYLTATDSALNEFTAGEVDCGISEIFPTPVVKPDSTAEKNVKIKNTGNLPAYVRVRVVYSDSIAEELSEIRLENIERWEYDAQSDFFYYTEIVHPGESTAALMSGISFLSSGESVDFEVLGDFQISIYAELMQHFDHEGACEKTEYVKVWNR